MKKIIRLGSFGALLGVAGVLFGSHAGGGFATGNQVTQYFVKYGWLAPITGTLTMLILAITLREAIVMYNNNECENYKDLFQELWRPYIKLEILWEIYYYFMVIIAVGAVIAGAASVFESLGVPYGLAVLIVGLVLLLLTIFGAVVVSSVSGAMAIIILICSVIIFTAGIKLKMPEISNIFATKETWGNGNITPFIMILTYAGFQSVVIPAVTASSRELLRDDREATAAMTLAFIMNVVALGLAILMLLGWYKEFTAAGEVTLPTLYVAKNIGSDVMKFVYQISLFLCLISTGVTTIFGMVNRFEDHKKLMFIKEKKLRRAFISFVIMVVAILLSLTGLDNIVKYGYGYCGYLGIFAIILPFLTIGVYKNRKFKKENPEYKWKKKRLEEGSEDIEIS